MARDMPGRQHFETPAIALKSWGRLDDNDSSRVLAIVDLLTRRLGRVHSVYIGQSGNAIGMSFGRSDQVDLYVHVGYVDVAADAVARYGGIEALAADYRGFRSAGGQRADNARFDLSGRAVNRRVNAPRAPTIAQPTHCGIRQPAGSECVTCGELVPKP